jgi:hypothetical protein
VIEAVDWDCAVLTNYSEENLGCRRRVSSGLDWVFSLVESAIVLEDDCLPHPSFFRFCETLLDYYWDDERIWVISGDNFQNGQWRGDGSYYFSHYNHCWGWASWRRAWQHYDDDLGQWPALKASGLLSSIFEDSIERNYWSTIWDCLCTENQPDSWAYRWAFTCIVNSGLTVLPNVNLVSNLGFRADGTHTLTDCSQANLQTFDINEIRHPSFIVRDCSADLYTFNYILGGNSMRLKKHWTRQIKRYLSTAKHKILSLKIA